MLGSWGHFDRAETEIRSFEDSILQFIELDLFKIFQYHITNQCDLENNDVSAIDISHM